MAWYSKFDRIKTRCGHFIAMKNYGSNDLVLIAKDSERPLMVRVAAVQILVCYHCPIEFNHWPYPAKRKKIRQLFSI